MNAEEKPEAQPETKTFIVTGIYRQEIHARGEAATDEEAAAKAFRMFQEWLLTMPMDMEGISFGPEDPSLEEQMTLTFAKNPTQEDPSYWTERKEMDVWEDSRGRCRCALMRADRSRL